MDHTSHVLYLLLQQARPSSWSPSHRLPLPSHLGLVHEGPGQTADLPGLLLPIDFLLQHHRGHSDPPDSHARVSRWVHLPREELIEEQSCTTSSIETYEHKGLPYQVLLASLEKEERGRTEVSDSPHLLHLSTKTPRPSSLPHISPSTAWSVTSARKLTKLRREHTRT